MRPANLLIRPFSALPAGRDLTGGEQRRGLGTSGTTRRETVNWERIRKDQAMIVRGPQGQCGEDMPCRAEQ